MRLMTPTRWLVLPALVLFLQGAAVRLHAQRGHFYRPAQVVRRPAPMRAPQQMHAQPAQRPANGQQQRPQQQRPQPEHLQQGQAQRPQQQTPAPIERGGQNATGSQSAPIERREPAQNNAVLKAGAPQVNPSIPNRPLTGDHVAVWMGKHSNLTPEQQQQELERIPGFHDYPPVMQQHFRDRLAQLNAMPPAQRAKTIARAEMMEKETPQQRLQVREATQTWAALPPDQKQAVGRSFRALRQLPPDQRDAALNSGRYTQGFNDQQKGALNGLIRAEPYIPQD